MAIVQLLVAGLAVGSVYALVALGFVLIYTSVNIVNFAQGDFSMVGAYFMVTLVLGLHVGWLISLLVAMVMTGIFGAITLLGIYLPVRNRSRNFLPVIIATVGGSIFLEHLSLIIYGPLPQQLPGAFKKTTFALAGVHVYPQYLLIIAVTAVMVAVLNWFFERTKLGKQMQATAQDPDTARLMGIRVLRMNALIFAISTGIGGLAGVLIAPVYWATPAMGATMGLKAFAAAIVGGFSSVKGAIIAGLAIGVIETFGAAYISGAYRDAYPFVVLILFLIFRPQGLFSEKISEKV